MLILSPVFSSCNMATSVSECGFSVWGYGDVVFLVGVGEGMGQGGGRQIGGTPILYVSRKGDIVWC